MAAIYLDNNATTRVDPRVIDAMLPLLKEHFGNPSSMHAFAATPLAAVRLARGQVRELVGAAHDDEIVFNSGGTEGANAAIRSALEVSPGKTEIITSAVEHPAVLTLCNALSSSGVRLHVIPVDKRGQLDMAAYQAALSDRVAVVSMMWANNETGVVFPVAELAAKAKAAGALFHTDAVQAAGKIPLNVKSTSIDMLSISGHKLHAPKGIGALYVRRGVRIAPQIVGGRQERGRRGGTENVPGIVALGKAAELAIQHLEYEATSVRVLRDRFQESLAAAIPGCLIVGGESERVPNTLNVAFTGVGGEDVVLLLDRAGIAASLGSACAAGSFEPSHVLRAMQVPETALHGGVRFSLSRDTTAEEIDRTLDIIPGVIAKLRDMALPPESVSAMGDAHA
ncbi:cysteine desulfurase NifS [Hyphomicrobium sp. NDB2Meth4]|uniref:cysteine desulfurase NifS n=1 Tax=Hyphomicrobium sp. NDB2Meth4 TaxID=1892846 RepID=UPI000931E567|nr:cysteine desulfurase NifS [Hyphomicrobium sp. NDB2Meth4]